MDLTFGNTITVNEFNYLRKSAGWNEIENSLTLKT